MEGVPSQENAGERHKSKLEARNETHIGARPDPNSGDQREYAKESRQQREPRYQREIALDSRERRQRLVLKICGHGGEPDGDDDPQESGKAWTDSNPESAELRFERRTIAEE